MNSIKYYNGPMKLAQKENILFFFRNSNKLFYSVDAIAICLNMCILNEWEIYILWMKSLNGRFVIKWCVAKNKAFKSLKPTER